jgi:hypothetical protein
MTDLAGIVAVEQRAVQERKCRFTAGAALASWLHKEPAAKPRARSTATCLTQGTVVGDRGALHDIYAGLGLNVDWMPNLTAPLPISLVTPPLSSIKGSA